jgi:tripartite-type tricarboxylate transporter receptor subunit TctC
MVAAAPLRPPNPTQEFTMPVVHQPRRRFVQSALAASAAIALPALAQAPAFPAKPIRLICPWPAGGSTDAVMRALAESAGKALGGQIVIENKAGASGMLGPNELVNAAPDGYTLSQITIGVARLPHMQKMQFDPLKDFTYIACLTGYTFGIVVRADSPIKSIKDLVDYAKANPGKFTFGSTGNGTTPHLAVEEFSHQGRYQAAAHSVQGQCRRHAGRAGRPRHVAQRRHGLGPPRGRGYLPPAGHLWLQADQALAQRAHAAGAGL